MIRSPSAYEGQSSCGGMAPRSFELGLQACVSALRSLCPMVIEYTGGHNNRAGCLTETLPFALHQSLPRFK